MYGEGDSLNFKLLRAGFVLLRMQTRNAAGRANGGRGIKASAPRTFPPLPTRVAHCRTLGQRKLTK
jgi:hypothetical protein